MAEWVKTVSAALCILAILIHLVPNGKFQKYVQFYGGLLFFLIASEPVLDFFSGKGSLERLLKLEFLKEDYYDLETSVSGLEELKNEKIRNAYQQEIRRQIQEIADAYGDLEVQVEVSFSEEEEYLLKEVWIYGEISETQQIILEQICQEISGIYAIDRKNIRCEVTSPL